MLTEAKHQLVFETVYPDSTGIKLASLPTPPGLDELFKKLRQVRRYHDPTQTPEGSVDDNGLYHTNRLRARATDLLSRQGFDDKIIQTNDRRLAVHDAGEVDLPYDMVATAKVIDDSRAEVVANEELAVAQKILSPEDFNLYLEFDQASRYLKGKSNKLPEPLTLFDKVLDFADGPTVYFCFYTQWVQSHPYDGKIPPENVFKYQLSETSRFRNRVLTTQGLDRKIRNLCLFALNQELKIIIKLWSEIDPRLTPPIMVEQLGLMTAFLNGTN